MQNFAPSGFSVEQLSQRIEIGKSRLLRLDHLAAIVLVHAIAPGKYLGERWIFAELVEVNHPHWRLKEERLLRSRLEEHQHRRGCYVGASECITDQVFASAQRLLKTRQDPRDREPSLLFLEWRVSILFREVLSALLRFGVIDAKQAPGDHHPAMRPQRVKRDFLP